MSAKPFHEPEENEFIRRDEPTPLERGAGLYEGLLKGLLDQIEASARQAIDYGLEGDLRKRLAKLLPDARPVDAPAPPADTAPAARSEVRRLAPAEIDTMLGLFNAKARLEQSARRQKPDSAGRRADEACAAFLANEIEKLKKGLR